MTETSTGDLVVAGVSTRCHVRNTVVLRAFHPIDGTADLAWGAAGTTPIRASDVNLPTALAPVPGGGVLLAGEAAKTTSRHGCERCDFKPYVA